MVIPTIIIILILLMLVVIFWQVSTFFSEYGGVGYLGSSTQVIKKALEMAQIKKGEKLLELGSASGDNLLYVSREFKVQITGIEISPYFYLVSKLKTRRIKNIRIIRADFRKTDFSDYDVVYCYLCEKLQKKLYSKFKKELHHGSRVVSYRFPIPGVQADDIRELFPGKYIFLYKF